MARHIRSGDNVVVIAGRDKGKTGKVLRILTAKDRCVVEGVKAAQAGNKASGYSWLVACACGDSARRAAGKNEC